MVPRPRRAAHLPGTAGRGRRAPRETAPGRLRRAGRAVRRHLGHDDHRGRAPRSSGRRSPRSATDPLRRSGRPGERDRRDPAADHRPGSRSRRSAPRARRGPGSAERLRRVHRRPAGHLDRGGLRVRAWLAGRQPAPSALSADDPRGGEPAGRADRCDERPCAFAIKETLQAGARIVNPSTGRPMFAFRLHQFLSKGDNVYVTLEPPAKRHVTSTYQVAAPSRRPRTDPTASSSRPRSAGSAARSTWPSPRSTRTAPPGTRPRRDNDASGGNDNSGYLFISDDQPWPETPEQALTDGRLPYSWVTFDPATGDPVIDPAKARASPRAGLRGRDRPRDRRRATAPTPPTCRARSGSACAAAPPTSRPAAATSPSWPSSRAEGRSSAMSLVTASDRAHAARDPTGPGRRGAQAARVRRQPPGREPAGRALQRLRPGHAAARRAVPGAREQPQTASPTRSSPGRSPRSSA